MFKITLNSKAMQEAYCVYQLSNPQGEVKYIGVSFIKDLLRLRLPKKHSKFNQVFPDDSNIVLTVLALEETRSEALKTSNMYINQCKHDLPLNTGKTHYNTPIICIETAETFNSMREVVDAHDVTLSALSRHLNKNPSYKTVKGKTYARL